MQTPIFRLPKLTPFFEDSKMSLKKGNLQGEINVVGDRIVGVYFSSTRPGKLYSVKFRILGWVNVGHLHSLVPKADVLRLLNRLDRNVAGDSLPDHWK